MSYRRKLIEVALPLDAINVASAREQSIQHGHPSSLHRWWARRPLAACRAVLFASLVDDPSARPDRFPTEEAQNAERERLFGLIEELVLWENSNNAEVLSRAKAEISKSCDGELPAVLDPFAGGGSIPLEAQRLGLEAHASDLNPVAVLINKAQIEIPPRFAGQAPVNPQAQTTAELSSWTGAQGLAADVKYYGKWMRDRAEQKIGHLYPKIELPTEHGGGEATVIAWLWARTVPCPNPVCGVTMPLLNSFALSRRKNGEAWLEPTGELLKGMVQFRVKNGNGCTKEGTVNRSGAICLACGSAIPLSDVRSAAQAGALGSQLVCIVAEGDRQRIYLEADKAHVLAANVEPPPDPPTGNLPKQALGFRVQGYGVSEWAHLFTARQLTTLCTFSDLVTETRQQVLADALATNLSDDPTPLREGGTGAHAYADAIAHYLGLSLDRLLDRCSTLCFWDTKGCKVQPVFNRPALPMIWVFAEGNPFSNSTGNYLGCLKYLLRAIEGSPAICSGHSQQLDARSLADSGLKTLVCTDPPYYDNIPYADLSDFFYVWLRRCLSKVYPDLFSTLLVPKAQEMIAEPARQGDWDSAATYFEEGLRQAFSAILKVHDASYPFTVFYAFKQSETGEAGTASTGWETMLEGLLDAGVNITGTWPIRTEKPGGLREVGRAALASSIVLVCRRRPPDAPLTTRRDFLAALQTELPEALRHLQQGNIAPVDMAQASIGPGMAIFSRYSRVIEADGTVMTVRDALTAINSALDVVLAEQEVDFDPDTRWAVAWYSEFGFSAGSAGVAETLSKAKNTSIGGLVKAGVLHQQGNSCQLLSRDELAEDWDPTQDTRLTVWEVTQHLVHAHETGGEIPAANLLHQVDGLAEPARELTYRLYHTCERKNWASDALAYNALIQSWPEINRLANKPPEGQTNLGFNP
ncbi:MAG: DUF1156 domain-containing protein [bacterium]|nr:DUF1156 domain-containing protein [bacterium]